MSHRVPDYCEPLVGWRVWTPTRHAIESWVFTGSWPAGKAFEAFSEPVVWSRPNRSWYGIHAYKTRGDLRHHLRFAVDCGVLIGEVWLWGQVIEHERGYLAQYAYPKRFVWGQYCDVAQLARIYGVPYEPEGGWEGCPYGSTRDPYQVWFPV